MNSVLILCCYFCKETLTPHNGTETGTLLCSQLYVHTSGHQRYLSAPSSSQRPYPFGLLQPSSSAPNITADSVLDPASQQVKLIVLQQPRLHRVATGLGRDQANADALSCLPLGQQVEEPLFGDLLLLRKHLQTVSPVKAEQIHAWTD